MHKTRSKNIQRGVNKKGGVSRPSAETLRKIERSDKRFSAIGSASAGKIVRGEVLEVVDCGASVDVDGVRCFVHISQLSERFVSNPSDILSVGKCYEFRILEKKLNKWQQITFILSLILNDKVVIEKSTNKFSNNPFAALNNLK